MLKTILFVIFLLLDLLMIGISALTLPFSVMLFDSGESRAAWTSFYSLLAIPLFAFLGIVVSLVVRFVFHNVDVAFWIAAAPLFYSGVFLIAFFLAS